MTRDRLVVAVLALVVVTAGCATDGPATPTEGQTSVTVAVENDGDGPYTAEVLLIPDRLSQLSVAYESGVSQPVTNLSSVRGVYAFAWRNVTDVRLPPGVEAGSSSRFQLSPGDRAETQLSAPVADATLLVVIRQDDRVAAWATMYCGQENTLDRVDIGASAGNPGRFTSVDLSCAQR
ncbi:hypothetical protein [Haloarcula brevis]|uniref:hypothetical protein n=1 Tax=Haloarcula brevis TaxID=3111453 RepID=UPI00300EE5E9